ncbi:protein ANTAGONIST OF LIKE HETEROCHROMATIN PROTEIN 1 [Andrographis paniculata]|uniref:protein ANTAGONIST OF LIKE HETEROCHROMATIN PROTEIN 1 n=1 Tax=Andrographis paniculata TaxID=175694 RepID=UPI0021E98977|nr:protein ANTAGONIST OF LIKE HETEROCHROMATIN PROTEIN 1 [Andrographis paniculata]
MAMAPPKKLPKLMKNKDAKKNTNIKIKIKKKTKTAITKTTLPVDNTAVDSEWWEIFWNKNSPNLVSKTAIDEEEGFKHFFRVSKKTFEYICSLVREDLISRPPSGLINIEGRLLSVEKQVAIALRRLASGESQVSVGASFGVGQSTVSQVTWRFIEAMEERSRHHLKWPSSDRLQQIKSGFETLSGLPNCCGAIDATHIVMTLPAVQTSDDWCDQKNNYSMFVQGVVDFETRFLDIVTGWPGGMPISRLLKCSGFYKLCESGGRLNGNAAISNDGEAIREYIVGGASYPLLPWLITPRDGGESSSSVTSPRLNEMIETARSTAAKAFSQLKGAWRILNKVMWRPDKRKLPSIVLVCCLLHNIVIDCGDCLHSSVALSGHHDGDYKAHVCKQVDPDGRNAREVLARSLS